jgi:hypothetical protein
MWTGQETQPNNLLHNFASVGPDLTSRSTQVSSGGWITKTIMRPILPARPITTVFLARPEGMMQGRGPMLAFWDDVLPPIDDDMLAANARGRRGDGRGRWRGANARRQLTLCRPRVPGCTAYGRVDQARQIGTVGIHSNGVRNAQLAPRIVTPTPEVRFPSGCRAKEVQQQVRDAAFGRRKR